MTTVDMRTGEVIEDAPLNALATLDPSEIDKAADPGAFVVLCLERSKTWLTEALGQGDIASIVEMKSQAEAIRVYTVQKQLGKDTELAATEIVRRAERGIGLAIRQGQEAGEIRKRGELTVAYDRWNGDRRDTKNSTKASPTDFSGHDELSDAYAVTDDVTDEQFEAAISEAKAEKNLSRANVVRKVKGEPGPVPKDRPEHLRKMRRHDPNRIVNEIATGLEGYALVLDLIDFESLDQTQIAVWSGSLSKSLQSLNRLNRQLKELDQT